MIARFSELAVADLRYIADYLIDNASVSVALSVADNIESTIPVILSDAVHCNTPPIMTPVGDLPRLFADYGFGVLAQGSTSVDIVAAVREAIACPPSTRLGDHTGLGELLSLESSCQRLLQVLNPDFHRKAK